MGGAQIHFLPQMDFKIAKEFKENEWLEDIKMKSCAVSGGFDGSSYGILEASFSGVSEEYQGASEPLG